MSATCDIADVLEHASLYGRPLTSVPDFGYLGVCPVCIGGGLLVRLTSNGFGEMSCGAGCDPVKVLDSFCSPPSVSSGTADPRIRGHLPLFALSSISSAPIEWLWHRRIPAGKLTLIEGHRGTGKSFVAIDIAAKLVRGLPLPDGAQGPPGKLEVLILDYENGASTVKRRLEAAGVTDRVQILDLSREPSAEFPAEAHSAMHQLRKPENVAWLEQHIREHTPDVKVIVLDGLLSALGGTDPNDEARVREALTPLCEMAARMRITLIGIKHFRKDTRGSSRAAGAGSQAWNALARCVIQLWRNEGKCFLAWEKMNDCELPDTLTFDIPKVPDGETPALHWTGRVTLTAAQLARMEAAAEERLFNEEEVAKHRIVMDLLPASGDPVTPDDLAELAKEQGIEPNDIAAALEAAKRKKISGVKYGKVGFGGRFHFVRNSPPQEAEVRVA